MINKKRLFNVVAAVVGLAACTYAYGVLTHKALLHTFDIIWFQSWAIIIYEYLLKDKDGTSS